jgi:hypothetical protein
MAHCRNDNIIFTLVLRNYQGIEGDYDCAAAFKAARFSRILASAQFLEMGRWADE